MERTESASILTINVYRLHFIDIFILFIFYTIQVDLKSGQIDTINAKANFIEMTTLTLIQKVKASSILDSCLASDNPWPNISPSVRNRTGN